LEYVIFAAVNREQIFTLIAVPLYFVAMLLELFFQSRKQHKGYQLPDTLMSFWFALVGASFDILMKGVCFMILDWCNDHAFFTPNLLTHYPVFAWIIVFLAQDLAFYWLHRTEHTTRIFWAVHSNHHSSPNYNFAVALRSSVFQPFYRFLFYIPVAFLGFDGLTIMFIYALNQFYQFWLHTEAVGKLPTWYEWFFVTPSHHRVHHASNIRYLDRNMGQVLIIWDKLFGTFQEELPEDKPVFGLTKPLESHHPIHAILHEFYLLRDDWRKTPKWSDRLRYLIHAPGWSHDGSTKTANDLRREQEQNG